MVVVIIEDDAQLQHDPEKSRKLQERRPTKAVDANFINVLKTKRRKIIHRTVLKWWQTQPLSFAFNHPHVKSRLEKLMASNVVSLTDRTYMTKLTERILEDHVESMEKRIKIRESEEMERIKNLVLTGQIPKAQAPASMAKHPVMLIEKYCNQLIYERRKKIKIPKVHIPTHLYYDDTPDPPSGLSIEKGHHYRIQSDRLCNPITRFASEMPATETASPDEAAETKAPPPVEVPAATQIKEIEGGIEEKEQLTQEPGTEDESDRLKFKAELINKLKSCQTVEEMYKLADDIIGELKTFEREDVTSTMTALSELSSIKSEAVERASISVDKESTTEG